MSGDVPFKVLRDPGTSQDSAQVYQARDEKTHLLDEAVHIRGQRRGEACAYTPVVE